MNQNFPEEFKEQSDFLEDQGLLIANKFQLVFEVGNTYRHIDNPTYCRDGTPNEHGWTCFFRLAAENSQLTKYLHHLIKKVTFELHCTAAVPKRVIETSPNDFRKSMEPLEISYKGWGSYDIPIKV